LERRTPTQDTPVSRASADRGLGGARHHQMTHALSPSTSAVAGAGAAP
jgi:hypothetical protein